jgi:hypothetical protein
VWLSVRWLALQVANDPAHDSVLHHGMGFTNRSSASFIPARRTRMDPAGYSIRWVGVHDIPHHVYRHTPYQELCLRHCSISSIVFAAYKLEELAGSCSCRELLCTNMYV